MIALDTTTKSLQIVLAGAKNTNDASWATTYEIVPTSQAPGAPGGSITSVSLVGTTSGVTAVTLVPAPGKGFYHRLKSFQLFNADLAAITLSLQIVDSSGPTTTIIQKQTKQTLENITYEDGLGFEALDANGAIISQAATTSANASTALAAGSQASSMASIALLGSSQASSTAALVPASVSSQASSMAALVPASVSSAASLGLLVSTQVSGASVQSFTSTNWSTVSSAASRVKSSFSW